MDCRIVFYSAIKTSLCERALKKSFSELGLTLANTSFATECTGLGAVLINAFKKYNLVFVIGGLCFDDYRSIKKIISNAVADTKIDDYKKLENKTGSDGYVLRAQNQILVLLPDEPEQIENIMQGNIRGYIKIYNKVEV